MRYYESLYIVNPGYEGDSLQAIKDEYANFVSENGGRIYNVEDWGKKRLAYRIAKQKYGTYVLMEFAAEGSIISELEESQRLNDAILGYLTVRLESEPDLSDERKKRFEDEEEAGEDEEEFQEEEDEDVAEEETEEAGDEADEEEESDVDDTDEDSDEEDEETEEVKE